MTEEVNNTSLIPKRDEIITALCDNLRKMNQPEVAAGKRTQVELDEYIERERGRYTSMDDTTLKHMWVNNIVAHPAETRMGEPGIVPAQTTPAGGSRQE